MIDIVDGIGRNVLCEKCKQNLTLSSQDDYKGCVNCKFENDLSYKVGRWYEYWHLWLLGILLIIDLYLSLFS